MSVYQDQAYVPLIIKYPNTNKPDVVNDLVSSIDLMPTVLDVLGYKIPENIQGRSLKSIDSIKPREIVSESFPFGYMIDWHKRFDRIERAIYSGSHKFISSTTGKRELYDLSKDPNEKVNLYSADHPVSRELESQLNQWLKDTEEESGTAAKLDKDALERLKALGYIQ